MNAYHSSAVAGHIRARLAGGRQRALLPNEPCLHLPAVERALTEQHLLPVLPALAAFFLAVRQQLDPELEHLKPVKLGKPYPLGQCLEIARAAQKRLRTVEETNLPPDAVQGLRAFRAFLRAGGTFRQVWGDLRGQYFQNAFQLGSLYVDVSNDTVVPTKPKVEVLPFEAANFVPVRCFSQFRQLARSYWQHEVYPNHVLPELAPHCPLIHVRKDGQIRLHDATQYMLAMTRSQAFKPSEAVLCEAPMPQAVFDRVRSALQDEGWVLASTPEQGRLQALQQCRTQRAKRWHLDRGRLQWVIHDVHRLNLRLEFNGQTRVLPLKPQAVVDINTIEHHVDHLADDVKVPWQRIRYIDQALAGLQAQMAALQAARNVYLEALAALLPIEAGDDKSTLW